ncbi:uncharacterized protein HMPREF1541_09725 [Cyphellophora europaea CBS 101466]|uniref:CENP-V/GFA domain-containing protein n=1 Tax=Cyphellophora europaea (strain CBS 101466) TaxID=1220924 RepID=W2S888_CYPE1|nr:uncharacterized protein HMPREF1541_09725 [Cyphellophora europaea CBS 101466]ETN44850.1 hypothetical protein HMPREF1541_09725 [Cyphellophora europaea CBS 101466]
MPDSVPTSSAQLNCLCGAITLPGSVLDHPTFPIPEEICHCNPCRYVSGSLSPAFPRLTSAPPPAVLAKLTCYSSSDRCNRYFCSTCGAHCFVEHPQVQDEWHCNAGIIDPPASPPVKDVILITSHAYIDDAIDGGLTPLFLSPTSGYDPSDHLYPEVRGKNAVKASTVLDMAKKALSCPLPGPDDTLSAKCHCGGVSLSIERADYVRNPHNVGSSMMPSHPNKYVAWFCVCRSCRLATGYSLQPMVYVPPAAIRNATNGAPVVFGRAAKEPGANKGLKLKHYLSTEDVQRSFCGGCGATVFYTFLGESDNGVVDVSAGILRADSGSLAREWVEWRDGYMSHEEECVDKSQAECVKKGWTALGLNQA